MSKKPRVAIIGAGVSGLTAIKACLEVDVEPVCYEKKAALGGVWVYDEDTTKSGLNKCTLMNSCKESSAFSDFPVPIDFPLFLTNQHARKYLELYAENFGLKKFIKFNHELVSLKELEDGTWKVKITGDGTEIEEVYDYVLLGEGHHNHPITPQIKGLDQFKGKVTHSMYYRTNEEYKDKRVLMGESPTIVNQCHD